MKGYRKHVAPSPSTDCDDYYAYSLKMDVKQNGYSQELLHMTWEDIESIPCITEMEGS